MGGVYPHTKFEVDRAHRKRDMEDPNFMGFLMRTREVMGRSCQIILSRCGPPRPTLCPNLSILASKLREEIAFFFAGPSQGT